MLLVDKYRPVTLDKLTLHPVVSNQLKRLAGSGDFPHLLVYGAPGAGKKTRVMAILRELFGTSVTKLRVEHRQFKTNSKTIDLSTVASNYHIEVNPSDAGFQDRIVIQELIKEIAENQPLDIASAVAGTAAPGSKGFKVVVINEVDQLTRDAQHALRRTMERYMATCRLILCCNSSTRVIEPLRSRCLGIRIPSPTKDEIVSVLQFVCKKESMQLPAAFAERLATEANGNLRKALLMLESSKATQYPFTAESEVQRMDWETFIDGVALQAVNEQSTASMLKIRGKLYELLTHCIPPEIIIKQLTVELVKKLDSQLKYEVVKWAAYYVRRAVVVVLV
eukprot:TRINITY_DN7822_c0_g1_i2.p1 TRINITY_DN7822_c0_g1~~TRINITY_DN7822_c0_g1_i2.p1  ORF type:complete len:336 (-),score=69.00 TRINITY_DN7822_c0_g1_i2:264-1271(-)